MSFTFKGIPAGGRKPVPEEPTGLWPKKYRAMSVLEFAGELTRLMQSPEIPRPDYDRRRKFILRELDQRSERVD